jgi:Zn-dependent protease with chaperone function
MATRIVRILAPAPTISAGLASAAAYDGGMRRLIMVTALFVLAGCATVPEHAYFPSPSDPATKRVAASLYHAARAASDDPARYSFALIGTRDVSAYTADDATFYFSEGLTMQPPHILDALIAHEVAHELLGHSGRRRALSLGLSAGFSVLGFIIPGAGLIDFLINPLLVRAYTRDQEIAADLKAVEVLRSMSYDTPRALLSEALRRAATINGRPRGGWFATEPDIDDRLSALEPLETVPASAARMLTPSGR